MRKFILIALLLLLPVAAHAVTWFSCDGNTFCGTDNYGHGSNTITLAATPVDGTSSPVGAAHVWSFNFAAGSGAGEGIADAFIGSPGARGGWLQFWFKYSTNFEFNTVENKVIYMDPSNTEAMALKTNRGLLLLPQGAYMDSYYPNVNTSLWYVQDRNWHKFKCYMYTNDLNQWNGIYQAWIDDVQISNYSTVYYGDDGGNGLTNVRFSVIYGGGGQAVPHNQQLYIAGVYFGSTDPGGSSAGDTQPPYVSSTDPPEGSTGRDNTVRTVSAAVADAGGGLVVRSTVTMDINTNGGSWTTYSYGSGLTFVPNTATATSYTITRTNGSDWPAGATVGVRINASDNASPANVMPQEAYTFQTAFAGTSATKTKAEALAYLAALPNQPTKKILSGQRIENNAALFNAVATASGGIYPAVMALDLGASAGTPSDLQTIVDHWNAGGLVVAVAHWADPANGNSWTWPPNSPMFDLANAYTSGNSTYDNFRTLLSNAADKLDVLKAANVVVIFNPLHEMNDSNNPPSFWWAGGGSTHDPAKYVLLYRYVHDYMVTTRGLTNIIWGFAGTRYLEDSIAAYYPGTAYVDVVGFSYYSETGQFNAYNAISTYNTLLAYSKPFAITELGECSGGQYGGAAYCSNRDSRVIINDIETNFPLSVYWYNWADEYALGVQSYVPSLLGDSRVVNRSDNPSGAVTAHSVTITTTSLPSGTVGSVYSQQLQLTATGGTSPYTWSIVSGSINAGLSLSSSGVISGIPTTAGTSSFTVRVTDSSTSPVTDDQALSIVVAPLVPGGQTTVTGLAFTDTYIDSGSASSNFSTSQTMDVYQWPAATVANRIILKNTDLVSLPNNITITSAKLRLMLDSHEGSGGTNPMRVHAKSISGTLPDPATVTWTSFAGTLSSDLSVTDVSLVSGWFEWDVTSYVAAQYANSKATVYLELDGASDGATNTSRIFASVNNATAANRPQLVITYTQNNPQPGPSISAPGKLRVSHATIDWN